MYEHDYHQDYIFISLFNFLYFLTIHN